MKNMSEQEPWQGENRRKTPRTDDKLYRMVVGINLFAWLLFVVALIVFHYARPELVSGLQEYWGVDVRTDWSDTLSFYLILLLCLCIVLATITLILKRRRSRRKGDFFGVNVGFLLAITLAGLVWVLTQAF